MSDSTTFVVTYWGTRGTIPAPLSGDEVTEKIVAAVLQLAKRGAWADISGNPRDAEVVRKRLAEHLEFHRRATYGGNTTCIEVQTDDAHIIVDLGSGSRQLGVDLQRRWRDPEFKGDRSALVLLTHGHVDHTLALPFVEALYDPANNVRIRGPQAVMKYLERIFVAGSPDQGILFPQTLDMFAGMEFAEPIIAGDVFDLETTRVRTCALNHPGGCLGYRIECRGKAIVIATDHEQRSVPDVELAAFATGADLLYADAQFLAEEYDGRASLMGDDPCSRVGWGHSYVEAVVATAIEARVRRLHLGHHDPRRDDEALHRIECYARALSQSLLDDRGSTAERCELRLAPEGLTVRI